MIPPDGTENPALFVIKIVGGTVLFLGAGLVFYFRGNRPTPA